MILTTESYGEVVLLTSPALVGANESIGFKTDVFESKNGTETRIPLKDKARQTLSFSSVVVLAEIAKHFNTQWGGIRKNWAVPLFQESQFVGDVSADFVMCRTDIYSFYEGSLALLKNDTEQILVEIDKIEVGRLLLKNTVNIANAKLYPVRLCFVNGDISRQISGVHAQASIQFSVIDEFEITHKKVAFILDDSGSMSAENMSNMKAGVNAILERLRSSDFMVQAINSGVRTYYDAKSTDIMAAQNFVNSLVASGSTSATLAYENINTFFDGDFKNGVVITLSDGAMQDVDQAKSMIATAFASVKFIGLGMGTIGSLNDFDNTGNAVQVVDADGIVAALADSFKDLPESFLGNDLYFFCLTYSGSEMNATLSQQQNIVDNEVGVIFQNSDWDFARYSKQYRAIIKGADELHAYRQFLFRRRGKYRSFWLPTYESNMRCKSIGLVSSVMLIEADQYKQLADNRKHIAIKSNGTWTAHTVTASTLVPDNAVKITILPALNKDASSIQRISYLGLHRLDADSVDLNYQGAGIVEVSVPILEIGV